MENLYEIIGKLLAAFVVGLRTGGKTNPCPLSIKRSTWRNTRLGTASPMLSTGRMTGGAAHAGTGPDFCG